MARVSMKDEIRLEQAKRLEHCPEDRLPWYSSETAAINDRYVLKRYVKEYQQRGFRALTSVCREIEHNNYLPVGSVTEERMMKVAKNLGYDPYNDYEDEEDE